MRFHCTEADLDALVVGGQSTPGSSYEGEEGSGNCGNCGKGSRSVRYSRHSRNLRSSPPVGRSSQATQCARDRRCRGCESAFASTMGSGAAEKHSPLRPELAQKQPLPARCRHVRDAPIAAIHSARRSSRKRTFVQVKPALLAISGASMAPSGAPSKTAWCLQE